MDNSFLRLKNTFADAKNLNESKAVELEYVGQIHLVPNETYLQITDSAIPINFSAIDVYLVDCYDNVLEDATPYVFWTPFTDGNGIEQIAWEWINVFDYNTKPVALKFVERSNNDTFWTNLFITTNYRKDYTTRIDYKSNGFHYGTDYSRADYYQSIRLSMYYNNPINESERAEYHQISTDVTVSQRNINKQKERFVLDEAEYFTLRRLEMLLSGSEIYFDNKRYYNTTPIEYPVREGDSNISEAECIMNPTEEVFTFTYQIFQGLVYTKIPEGVYTLSNYPDALSATFNIPITLNTGTLTVYDADTSTAIVEYDQDDMVVASNVLSIPSFTGVINSNGNYYINLSQGLVSGLGIEIEQIFNTTDWAFVIQDGDYDSADYTSPDYLTT